MGSIWPVETRPPSQIAISIFAAFKYSLQIMFKTTSLCCNMHTLIQKAVNKIICDFIFASLENNLKQRACSII